MHSKRSEAIFPESVFSFTRAYVSTSWVLRLQNESLQPACGEVVFHSPLPGKSGLISRVSLTPYRSSRTQ